MGCGARISTATVVLFPFASPTPPPQPHTTWSCFAKDGNAGCECGRTDGGSERQAPLSHLTLINSLELLVCT